MSASADHHHAPRLTGARLAVTVVFGLAAFTVLIALGTWQMQRLAWKQAVIARVEERVRAEPVPLPPPGEWAALDLDAWEYRPVQLTGRFRHDLEAYVYTLLSEPRGQHRGAGYWVMTPLEIEPGVSVVVNRGFVPVEDRDPILRPEGQTAGTVTVTGLFRTGEPRNLFTPGDDPARHLFYVRDPVAIASGYGIDAARFSVDLTETPPGGLPQGGETRLVFTNRHLEYALTWYGLAASLVGVVIAWAFSARRRRNA